MVHMVKLRKRLRIRVRNDLPGVKGMPFLNQTIWGFGLAPETLQLMLNSSCSLISTLDPSEYPVMLIEEGGTKIGESKMYLAFEWK